jgi:peptidoglycan/LPS O-acetylase OafA/YrhL
MVWLGEASFAFYLFHKVVMSWGQGAVNGDRWDARWSLPFWLGFGVVTFAVTLGLAALLHTYVEKPLMRRFARPKPRAVTPPPAEPPFERELQGAGER